MAKNKISEYSTNAGANTDISGINIDEGCSPANINNAIRSLMAALKGWQGGTVAGDVLQIPAGGTGATTLGGAGITTLANAQTITGAKTITGALGITDPNPRASTWPAYAKSKLATNPAMVFDAGTSTNSIASLFIGGAGGGDITLFAAFAYGNVDTGVSVGNIGSSGTSTIFATSSDYRLKENIQPMTGALAKVAMLKPVKFKWKTTGEADEGFIAHELQAVIPEAVIGKKDELYPDGKPKYQSVDTSFLVATLTCAIQEQQAMIEDLKVRVQMLEAK